MVLLGIALTLGIVLRVMGLGWGIGPDLFHPDEWKIVNDVILINDGNFKLGDYNYPSGFHYICSLVTFIAAKVGIIWESLYSPHIQLLCRWMTILFAMASIVFIALCGARLYSWRVGAFSALFLAIATIHVVHSHYCTVDVAATAWILFVLYISTFILEKPSMKHYIWAGIGAGLAAATKYNAGLAVVMPITAHLLNSIAGDSLNYKLKSLFRALFSFRLVVLGFVALIAFIALVPYAVLDFQWVIVDGMIKQIRQAKEGPDFMPYMDKPPGWYYYLIELLPISMGAPLLALCLLGGMITLTRWRRADIILLSFLVPYYLGLGSASLMFIRHALFLVPILVLWGGISSDWLIGIHEKSKNKLVAYVPITLLAMVLIYSLAHSLAHSLLFVRKDTRDQAMEYLVQCYDPLTPIGVMISPVGLDRSDKPALHEFFDNICLGYYLQEIFEYKPEVMVFSNYDYRQILRMHHKLKRSEWPHQRDMVWEADLWRIFLAERFDGWWEEARLERRATLLGMDFSADWIPHDWMYLNPTVHIFRRDN